ncbi:MAG: protein-L-isoaspartate O-methyltransferase, partial [Maribacter sp.]|nr:protein-L-isoaspartate O-methyltransferase [Maribacter sp.]
MRKIVSLLFGLFLMHSVGVLGQTDYSAQRKQMVERQLQGRDIVDLSTLSAMLNVPRHKFVPDEMKPYAYNDRPLPIGNGQTISQPY